MYKQTFSISHALSVGFKLFFKNLFLFAKLIFVTLLTAYVMLQCITRSIVLIFLNDNNNWLLGNLQPLIHLLSDKNPKIPIIHNIASLVFYIALAFIACIAETAIVRMELSLINGVTPDSKILFYRPLSNFKIFAVAALHFLLVTLGTTLFVIPGVFFAIRFYFVDYLVIDKDMTILESFKKSYQLTKGISFKLVVFMIITRILDFFIIPFFATGIAASYIYNKLVTPENPTVSDQTFDFAHQVQHQWKQPHI